MMETNNTKEITQRQAALIAGIGLLIMTISAIIAEFMARQKLVIPGNAAETVQNIVTNKALFRTGLFNFIIVLICDLLVSWGLYIFFAPTNKNLSLLTAWFRLVYTAIFAVAISNMFNVLSLVNGDFYLNTMGSGSLQAQVMLSLAAFDNGWTIGLVFFGVHLGLLGILAYKSGFVPKWLGILILIAGVGYFIDNFGKLVVPDYKIIISMFTFIGELILMIWLIFWGGKSVKSVKHE